LGPLGGALEAVDAAVAIAAVGYVFHDGFERVDRAVVEERLREGVEAEEGGRVEAACPQRHHGGGADFVECVGVEGIRRAELRQQLAGGQKACVGRGGLADAGAGPLRAAVAVLAAVLDEERAAGDDVGIGLR